MILSALRLFKSLSIYHYRTIVITILLPVIGPPIVALFGPDCRVLQVTIYIAGFLVWSVFAVLAVASMLRTDRAEAQRQVAQQTEEVSTGILRLREEHEDLRAGLRQQARDLKDLEETVRAKLEELGAVLPPRRISARGTAIRATLGLSVANASVTGGSTLARVRRRFLRATRWLWRVVYGKPEDD